MILSPVKNLLRRRRITSPCRFTRRARFETLEPRRVLSAPTLAAVGDVTLAAGTAVQIPLDGYDADGDALNFSVSSSNNDLLAYVPEGNRSMKIAVDGFGEMIFELFEQRAPETTARIIELADSGFYDGLIFHRVASYQDGTPFVIQGGDPLGTGTGGSGVDFDDEFHPELMHTSTGILSMAKGEDDTNDSQFFITDADTRFLDFNHSVFGQLVEGEAIREAIQSVEVDGDDKPLDDVVMTSVTIFHDMENGVLTLWAPEGVTGEADVTVTASDGAAQSPPQDFHVTIVQDTVNSNPYLDTIPDIHTTVDTPVTITLPYIDVEGDAGYFGGQVYPDNPDLGFELDPNTGEVTLTPQNGTVGVQGIYVGVAGNDWDTQFVPVFISPAAPTSVELHSVTDRGIDDTDGLTNFNGATLATRPRFVVSGVLPGAEVSVFIDGQPVGQGTASSETVLIPLDEGIVLADGDYEVTAVQTLRDQAVDIGNRHETVDLASAASPAMTLTIDATEPEISPLADRIVMQETSLELTVSATDAHLPLTFAVRPGAPQGVAIDAATGALTWTPDTDQQPGNYEITVDVTDAAGAVAAESFFVEVRAWPTLPGDLDGDGFVGGEDLYIINTHWGQQVTPGDLSRGDASCDGFVGGDDLIIVGEHWGESLDLLPGDANGDGFVGGDDLDLVRAHWGEHVTPGDRSLGDLSGDGFVGGDDLDLVRAYWGQSVAPASARVETATCEMAPLVSPVYGPQLPEAAAHDAVLADYDADDTPAKRLAWAKAAWLAEVQALREE